MHSFTMQTFEKQKLKEYILCIHTVHRYIIMSVALIYLLDNKINIFNIPTLLYFSLVTNHISKSN